MLNKNLNNTQHPQYQDPKYAPVLKLSKLPKFTKLPNIKVAIAEK